MESVINRIIEIDKNATERINSASEKRNHASGTGIKKAESQILHT